MFCNNCGKQIEGNETFCPFCGEKIIIIKEEEPVNQPAVTDIDYASLVAKAKEKDQDAFGKLYESTYQAAFYTAKGILHDDDITMDVVQDAYVKAWQKLDQLDDLSRFPYWIKRIAANGAKDYLKKKKETLFSQYEDDEGYVHLDMEDDRLDHQPEAQMDKGETRRLVEEILYDLPDEQRICTMMYYFDEMKIKEIAEDLAVSENTVKSRLNYAKKKIKEAVLDLEKKGTKLYGLSPIPFFIWLLREGACDAPIKPFAELWKILTGLQVQTTSSISSEAASHLNKISGGKAAGGNASSIAQKVAIGGAKKAAAHSVFHSGIAAKVAAVMVAGTLIGGAAMGVVKYNQSKNHPKNEEQTVMQTEKAPKDTKEESLKEAKTKAIEELKNYKNPDEYRAAEREELAKVIQKGVAAIEAAENEQDVERALTEAKSLIDQIKTNAQLTEEEKTLRNKLPALPELSLNTGVGGWENSIAIRQDGSFTGHNFDYNYDLSYDCQYSGQITDIERIDDYTYRCKIASVNLSRPVGTTWTENGMQYEAIEAGFAVGDTCYIYIPGKPISELSEAFLDCGGPNTSALSTLPCYALQNGDLGYYSEHFY